MAAVEQAIRAPLVPLWRMIRHLYPVYCTIAECLHLDAPPCDALSQIELGDDECLFQVAAWIEEVDSRTQPHHLRSVLQEMGIGSSDLTLQMWLQHFLSKPEKSSDDRDKIDFLLVHYLRLNLPPSLQEGRVSRTAIAAVLEPVVGADCEQMPAETQELIELIGIAERCRSLADIERSGIILRGRELKLRVGDLYFTPPCLLAFTHFNAVVRRECQRLMNSDLKFIGEALDRLDKQGITHVDCTAASWSDQESVADLKNKWATWELDNRDYSNDFFASLIGFRTSMDEAISRCVELSIRSVSQELHTMHGLLTEIQSALSDLPGKLSAVTVRANYLAERRADVVSRNVSAPNISDRVIIPKAAGIAGPQEAGAAVKTQPEAGIHVVPEKHSAPEMGRAPEVPAKIAVIEEFPVVVVPPAPTQAESQVQVEAPTEATANSVPTANRSIADPVEQPTPSPVAAEPAKTASILDLNEGISRLQKTLSGKRPAAVSIAVAGTRVLLTGAEVAMFSDNENASARAVQRAVMSRIFLVGGLEGYSKNRDKAKVAAVAEIARAEQESLRAMIATCKTSKLVREEEVLSATGKQLSAMLERAERILR